MIKYFSFYFIIAIICGCSHERKKILYEKNPQARLVTFLEFNDYELNIESYDQCSKIISENKNGDLLRYFTKVKNHYFKTKGYSQDLYFIDLNDEFELGQKNYWYVRFIMINDSRCKIEYNTIK